MSAALLPKVWWSIPGINLLKRFLWRAGRRGFWETVSWWPDLQVSGRGKLHTNMHLLENEPSHVWMVLVTLYETRKTKHFLARIGECFFSSSSANTAKMQVLPRTPEGWRACWFHLSPSATSGIHRSQIVERNATIHSSNKTNHVYA